MKGYLILDDIIEPLDLSVKLKTPEWQYPVCPKPLRVSASGPLPELHPVCPQPLRVPETRPSPEWNHPVCPQPLKVPVAGPSPEWTHACRLPYPLNIIEAYPSPAIPTPEHEIRFEDSLSDDPDFLEYKYDALRVMAERNGGSLVGHNPRMRRSVQSSREVDESYRTRRERNNMAAKQSRDRRKLRELHSTLKVGYLKKKLASARTLLAAKKCERCKRCA